MKNFIRSAQLRTEYELFYSIEQRKILADLVYLGTYSVMFVEEINPPKRKTFGAANHHTYLFYYLSIQESYLNVSTQTR